MRIKYFRSENTKFHSYSTRLYDPGAKLACYFEHINWSDTGTCRYCLAMTTADSRTNPGTVASPDYPKHQEYLSTHSLLDQLSVIHFFQYEYIA